MAAMPFLFSGWSFVRLSCKTLPRKTKGACCARSRTSSSPGGTRNRAQSDDGIESHRMRMVIKKQRRILTRMMLSQRSDCVFDKFRNLTLVRNVPISGVPRPWLAECRSAFTTPRYGPLAALISAPETQRLRLSRTFGKHVYLERWKWNSANLCNQSIAIACRKRFLEHVKGVFRWSCAPSDKRPWEIPPCSFSSM
jgi:hypothetical protein